VRKSKTGRKNPGASKRLKEMWAEDYEGMCKKWKDGWTEEKKAERSRLITELFKDPDFNRGFKEQCLGPKSDAQKQKMREAKLGVPKSAEHKLAMKESHIKRIKIVRIIEEEFGLSFREAQHFLKNNKEKYYKLYG